MLDAAARSLDRSAHLGELVEAGGARVVAQPQALPQHLSHRLADRVGTVIAGHRFDLGARHAQAGLERVGGIEQVAHQALARRRAPAALHEPQPESGGHERGEDQGGEAGSHGAERLGWQGSLTPARCRGKRLWALAPVVGIAGLTAAGGVTTIPRLMSANLPEVLDAWRMVAARRGVEGRLPLSALTRLRDSLADDEGEARFSIEFDHDALKVPYAELRIDAELPLQCQRTLERFLLPVRIEQRLGLIRSESEEAALPPGYEPLLVPDDGMLRTAELVEDELILAVPVVPVRPDSEPVEQDWSTGEVPAEPERPNPFAALASLKKNPK